MNSNVLGYTIMYHDLFMLSSKKANFFYLFLSIAVLAVSPIIHKGKITRRKRARMKSMKTSFVCCVLIMYHVRVELSNEKVKFFSFRRSKNVRYPCQPPVRRTLLSSCNASSKVVLP